MYDQKTERRAQAARRQLLGLYTFVSVSFRTVLFILLTIAGILLIAHGGH